MFFCHEQKCQTSVSYPAQLQTRKAPCIVFQGTRHCPLLSRENSRRSCSIYSLYSNKMLSRINCLEPLLFNLLMVLRLQHPGDSRLNAAAATPVKCWDLRKRSSCICRCLYHRWVSIRNGVMQQDAGVVYTTNFLSSTMSALACIVLFVSVEQEMLRTKHRTF